MELCFLLWLPSAAHELDVLLLECGGSPHHHGINALLEYTYIGYFIIYVCVCVCVVCSCMCTCRHVYAGANTHMCV